MILIFENIKKNISVFFKFQHKNKQIYFNEKLCYV